MKLEHMLEVEQAIHEIEERSNRNRLGMLVTQEVADYRAHGAKKDVETLLAVVNGVLDKLVVSGGYAHSEDILNVIYETLEEQKENVNV
jgi:butyrate kinase